MAGFQDDDLVDGSITLSLSAWQWTISSEMLYSSIEILPVLENWIEGTASTHVQGNDRLFLPHPLCIMVCIQDRNEPLMPQSGTAPPERPATSGQNKSVLRSSAA